MAALARSGQAAIVSRPECVAWSFDGNTFEDKAKCLRCEVTYLHRWAGVYNLLELLDLDRKWPDFESGGTGRVPSRPGRCGEAETDLHC